MKFFGDFTNSFNRCFLLTVITNAITTISRYHYIAISRPNQGLHVRSLLYIQVTYYVILHEVELLYLFISNLQKTQARYTIRSIVLYTFSKGNYIFILYLLFERVILFFCRIFLWYNLYCNFDWYWILFWLIFFLINKANIACVRCNFFKKVNTSDVVLQVSNFYKVTF